MDGLTIRPIAATDHHGLAASFERLSPESRYLRFFSPVPHLSSAQLDYLTDVDHHDHEALVAVDDAAGDIVGVARYVRGEPGVAEPAIAVLDEYQGRGIGSLLLDTLADRAREEGIGCFVALVLAENDAALAALGRLGETHVISQGPQVEVHIDLGGAAGATPPLRELLRHAAERSVAPAVSFLHRLAVGGQAPEGPRENVIVVACSTTALDQASHLALATGATVHVVGTRDEHQLDEAVAALRARGLAAEPQPGRGDLAATLLEVAGRECARLLVVDGTRPAHERFTLSTWDHVAHHAPCNVLVAR